MAVSLGLHAKGHPCWGSSDEAFAFSSTTRPDDEDAQSQKMLPAAGVETRYKEVWLVTLAVVGQYRVTVGCLRSSIGGSHMLILSTGGPPRTRIQIALRM